MPRQQSNWNIERIRRFRRNKLMTAVISSLKSIPINGPGGGGAALGDLARPAYQVVVSEEVATAAKQKFADEATAKRQHPKETSSEGFIDVGMSSSLQDPIAAGLIRRG
jgi:hypothetical protein